MASAADAKLKQFLKGYPWPSKVLGAQRPLEFLWKFDVNTTVPSLWTHISDTSRLNRLLGLSSLVFEERDGRLHGRSDSGGISQQWVELPWNWVAGKRVEAERAYSQGFASHVRVVYVIEKGDNKTSPRLLAYFGWLPKNWLCRLLLQFLMSVTRTRLANALAMLPSATTDDSDEQPQRSSFTSAPPPLPPLEHNRLRRLQGHMLKEGSDEHIVSSLADLIQNGDDLDVYRLRVKTLARQWGVPMRAALQTFLRATRAGMLEMRWDLICPHCRGVRDEFAELEEIPTAAYCEACAIEFGSDGEQAIEISFHIHPSIRNVKRQQFCSSETSAKRHIEIQQCLAPGASREFATELPAAQYRMRLEGDHAWSSLQVAPGENTTSIAWRASQAQPTARGAVNPRFELHNDTDAPQKFIIEHLSWSDDALKPADLFSFQAFRDLFSAQSLAAGVQLAVGEQTILFTDIVGSTEFYVTQGDPDAFMAVSQHFSAVTDVIRKFDGAVVKTIGDANMACFRRSIDAMRAALELHQQFGPKLESAPFRLRISIHTGVCIAVNLNSNIDYFGHTVNLTAKLQACAQAGDIAFSDAIASAPAVEKFLQKHDAAVKMTSLELPKIDGGITVHCWSTD